MTSALDPTIGGEIRLRLLFEPLLVRHARVMHALPYPLTSLARQSRPKLTVDDFQILRRIGQGSFGQVFRVRKRDTKRIYAMKVIRKASITSAEALAQVLAERQVLAKTIDSPFLVGLKFSFQSERELFLIQDYKSGGEMFQHLQRDGGRFEEAKVRFYVAEIILALEYLHENNIVYRCVLASLVKIGFLDLQNLTPHSRFAATSSRRTASSMDPVTSCCAISASRSC